MAWAPYTVKDAFDMHPTSSHLVPDSCRDQLKGAWFSLYNDLLLPSEYENEMPVSFFGWQGG